MRTDGLHRSQRLWLLVALLALAAAGSRRREAGSDRPDGAQLAPASSAAVFVVGRHGPRARDQWKKADGAARPLPGRGQARRRRARQELAADGLDLGDATSSPRSAPRSTSSWLDFQRTATTSWRDEAEGRRPSSMRCSPKSARHRWCSSEVDGWTVVAESQALDSTRRASTSGSLADDSAFKEAIGTARERRLARRTSRQRGRRRSIQRRPRQAAAGRAAPAGSTRASARSSRADGGGAEDSTGSQVKAAFNGDGSSSATGELQRPSSTGVGAGGRARLRRVQQARATDRQADRQARRLDPELRAAASPQIEQVLGFTLERPLRRSSNGEAGRHLRAASGDPGGHLRARRSTRAQAQKIARPSGHARRRSSAARTCAAGRRSASRRSRSSSASVAIRYVGLRREARGHERRARSRGARRKRPEARRRLGYKDPRASAAAPRPDEPVSSTPTSKARVPYALGLRTTRRRRTPAGRRATSTPLHRACL